MHPRYNSEVKQLLPAFTVDRWASHTNIVLDFEQIFPEQQVPKSNFRSKLPRFTLQQPYNSPTTHIKFSWTAADINYRLAGKFDREMNLAVGVETARLKSTIIISYATCNDIMHALALLAPSSAHLWSCTCS